MRTALFVLAVLLATLPGSASAACDWDVTQNIINNTPDAVYTTVNDMGTPKEDGIDTGHTTHVCGRIHYDTGLDSMYGTVAGWPAWAAAPDYVQFKAKIINENGSEVLSETRTVFYPATGNSGSIPAFYQVLNGTYNYTVTAYSSFVDTTGSNDFIDANSTRLWESALNAEGPAVSWNHPLQGHSETEIITTSVDATDATYNIFDVNGAVMVATNVADPGAGNFSGPSISHSGWTLAGGDEWTDTVDMENDGDAEWVSGGHPINGLEYKMCVWARNTPLQKSPTVCINITYTGSSGSPGGGPNNTGILRGVVFSNETGTPTELNGVLVSLPDIGWSTTTTIFGYFTFTDVPIDNYTIRMQKSGYVSEDVYQLWDHSDNDTFTGVLLLEATPVVSLFAFQPRTNEQIQDDLRTFVPILFYIGAYTFIWIVLVEAFEVLGGNRRRTVYRTYYTRAPRRRQGGKWY